MQVSETKNEKNETNETNKTNEKSIYDKPLIIGAGYGRTGTLSLKKALEILGVGPCYHMSEAFFNDHFDFWVRVFEKKKYSWEEIFDKYNSSTDHPVCLVWEELLHKFPNSKIILTVRSSESWLKSYKETIYNFTTHQPLGIRLYGLFSPFVKKHNRMMNAMNNAHPAFSPIDYSDEKVVKAYEDHIEYVKKTCPKERLLVFEAKDGWEPLCKFLGKEIPKESYPHVNDTQEFKQYIFRGNISGYVLFSGFMAIMSLLSHYLLKKYTGVNLVEFIKNGFLRFYKSFFVTK